MIISLIKTVNLPESDDDLTMCLFEIVSDATNTARVERIIETESCMAILPFQIIRRNVNMASFYINRINRYACMIRQMQQEVTRKYWNTNNIFCSWNLTIGITNWLIVMKYLFHR